MKLRINKGFLNLVILLLMGVLYITYEPFRSSISEIILLFTSKSTESIIGYLNSFDNIKPIVSIGLMLLQALIFTFKYEIVLFANIKVFGAFIGVCLSIIGRIIGAYICYQIGKSLISNKLNLLIKKLNKSDQMVTNHIRNNDLVNIFVRVLPLNFNLISYVSGSLALSLRPYMLNSIFWISLTTISYSLNNGYFSYSYEIRTIVIRLILAIIIVALIIREHYRVLGG